MNKFINGFLFAFLLLLLVGCAGILSKNEGIFGKSSKTTAQAATEIRDINTDIAKTDQQRLTHIGAFSAGIDYSLHKATNQEPAVTTAEIINTRVQELANKPDIDELKQIYKIIDNLLTNQITGQKLLEKKDKEISQLQNTIIDLNQQKDESIKGYMNIAEANASKADQYKATLQNLDSGWGLNAILYGAKKLITHIAIALGIFGVLFIVLRIAAASNPIAGSIFSIFEMAASWVINTIKSIFPKSINFSSLVPKSISDGYKSTLKNIMDDVLLLENQQKSSPANPKITLDELIVNLEKNLNTNDKVRVDEIRTELNWK